MNTRYSRLQYYYATKTKEWHRAEPLLTTARTKRGMEYMNDRRFTCLGGFLNGQYPTFDDNATCYDMTWYDELTDPMAVGYVTINDDTSIFRELDGVLLFLSRSLTILSAVLFYLIWFHGSSFLFYLVSIHYLLYYEYQIIQIVSLYQEGFWYVTSGCLIGKYLAMADVVINHSIVFGSVRCGLRERKLCISLPLNHPRTEYISTHSCSLRQCNEF